ncbi:MAG: GUN4 domain-containing protein [Aphanizomenon gracile PMC649.10]|nr:GUN4 domain-containing protein [Aphanizomenon gracile PMC649.10]
MPQFSNADYTKLRNLLVAQNWKEADQETHNVMIKAVGKDYGDWFTSDKLLNFPYPDLSIIDLVKEEYNTI